MSGGGTNTVSQQTVPSWLQPYYTSALQTGQQLTSGAGPAYYPGNQVAPLNQVQESGIDSIIGAASQPNASDGAQTANEFETSGALLNPSSNPYLQQTFQQGANAVQNQLSTEFAGSGRNIIGSLPVQSDEMNNLATQLYGGQYDTGLNTMTQASALAPSIDAGTYQPGDNLLSTGAGLQTQTQNNINQNVNAWNYQQQMPYTQLSYMAGLLGNTGSKFGASSSSTTGTASPWSTALGAGLLGNSLYANLGGAGAGAGAAAGSAAALDASLATADAGALGGTIGLGTAAADAAPALALA
jgi:hypothetical protein